MSPVFLKTVLLALWGSFGTHEILSSVLHCCQVRFINYVKPPDQCSTAPVDVTSGSRLHSAVCVSFWWRSWYFSSFHSNEVPFRMKDVLFLKPTRIISKINSTVCSKHIGSGINPLDKRSESLCQLDRDICWFEKIHHGWSVVRQWVYRFSTLIDNNREH